VHHLLSKVKIPLINSLDLYHTSTVLLFFVGLEAHIIVPTLPDYLAIFTLEEYAMSNPRLRWLSILVSIFLLTLAALAFLPYSPLHAQDAPAHTTHTTHMPPVGSILCVSPTHLTFYTKEKHAFAADRTVIIRNKGKKTISWRLSNPALSKILFKSATFGGKLAPGKSAALHIFAHVVSLPRGAFTLLVTLVALDSHNHVIAGSPTVLTVSLIVKK
jgi:hypothetical protein